jgi:hypothetical protein
LSLIIDWHVPSFPVPFPRPTKVLVMSKSPKWIKRGTIFYWIILNEENVSIYICRISKIVHEFVDKFMPLVLALIRLRNDDPMYADLKEKFENANLDDPIEQNIIAIEVLTRIMYASYVDELDAM